MSPEPSDGAHPPIGPLVPGPPPDLRPLRTGVAAVRPDEPGTATDGDGAAPTNGGPPTTQGNGAGNGHGNGHGPFGDGGEAGGNGAPGGAPTTTTADELLGEAGDGAPPPAEAGAPADDTQADDTPTDVAGQDVEVTAGADEGGAPSGGDGAEDGGEGSNGHGVVTTADLLADAPGDDEAGGSVELVPSSPDAPTEQEPEADGPEEDLPGALRARRLRDLRYKRRFGVAPFVRPTSRRSHRQRRRDYRKLGFIELTQDKAKLRHRILPRTVIGISTLIAAFGVGSAFAGAALYAYYDNRLTENEARVTEFATGFENNYNAAITQIQQQRDQSLQTIADRMERVQEAINDANAMVELPTTAGGGVWLVRTLDPTGKPTMGSAFVVPIRDGEAGSSYLLTAYEVVAASTAQPGPAVTIEKPGESLPAEVWAWDPSRGLALLKVARGDLAPLAFAPDQERGTARGSRVYALSGLGGAGATVSPGNVSDVSEVGLRHNIDLSVDFRGGPIVNAAGQVLGIATLAYQPLGFDPGPMPYAPSIEGACQQVLSCPPGLLSGGG